MEHINTAISVLTTDICSNINHATIHVYQSQLSLNDSTGAWWLTGLMNITRGDNPTHLVRKREITIYSCINLKYQISHLIHHHFPFQICHRTNNGSGAGFWRWRHARGADLRGLRDAPQHNASRCRRTRRHPLPQAVTEEGGLQLPHISRAGNRSNSQRGKILILIRIMSWVVKC